MTGYIDKAALLDALAAHPLPTDQAQLVIRDLPVVEFDPAEALAARDRVMMAKGMREAAGIAACAPYKRGGIVCGCSEGLSAWTENAILVRADEMEKGESDE